MTDAQILSSDAVRKIVEKYDLISSDYTLPSPSAPKPLTVRVGPIDFEVKIVRGLNNDNGQRLEGEILYNSSVIHIEPRDNSPQMIELILIHEIIHGIINYQGIYLGDEEEDVVERLAYGLYSFLKDNDLPQVFKTLKAMAKAAL